MKKLFILIPTLILALALCGCGHEHTPVTDEAVAPTCTQTGLTEGSHCSECGEVIIPQEEVEILDHTVAIDQEVAATCLATGLTEGSHCAVCNEVLVAQEETPITDHAVVTAEAVPPTCTAVGLTEGSVCSVCNQVFIPQEEIPMIEHTIVITPAVEATCSSTGLTEGSHCSTCNQVFLEQEEIPLTDHDKKIVKETASTCQKAGNRTFYCSGCNKETGSVELYKIAHKPVAIPATIATCTQNGLTEGSYCSVCKATVTPQLPTPKAEHKYKDGKCTMCGQSDIVAADEVKSLDLPVDTYEMNILYGNVDYIKNMRSITWNGTQDDGKFFGGLTSLTSNCYALDSCELFGFKGYAGMHTNSSKTQAVETMLVVLSNSCKKWPSTGSWDPKDIDEVNKLGIAQSEEILDVLDIFLKDLGDYTVLSCNTYEERQKGSSYPKKEATYHDPAKALDIIKEYTFKGKSYHLLTDSTGTTYVVVDYDFPVEMLIEAKGLIINIEIGSRTVNGMRYGALTITAKPADRIYD